MTRAKDISKILTDADISGNIDVAGVTNLDVVDIDGTLNVAGETTLQTHLNMGDGDIIKLGASADLQIQHNGSGSYVSDSGTGFLFLQGAAQIRLQNPSGANYAIFADGGASTLYHNNSAKFATTSTGVTSAGTYVGTSAGSASAPNFAVTSGSLGANGMFVASANTLSLGTGGTERFVIDGSGNTVVAGSNAGSFRVGTPTTDRRTTLQGNNQYRLALQNGSGAVVYIGSGGSNNFRISNVGGATIFEIDDNKDIILGGAGAGIHLGVQNAAASNLLDDYEEGTWTPVIGGPSSRGGTWSSAIGRYTKVGNKVTLQVDITGSAMYFTATSGYTAITGVPFYASQPSGSTNYAGSWSGNNVGVSSGGATYLNATTMYVHSSNSGQSSSGVNGIGVTITYFTAA